MTPQAYASYLEKCKELGMTPSPMQKLIPQVEPEQMFGDKPLFVSSKKRARLPASVEKEVREREPIVKNEKPKKPKVLKPVKPKAVKKEAAPKKPRKKAVLTEEQKIAKRLYQQEHYRLNKEAKLAYSKQYYIDNKERCNAQTRDWAKRNEENVRAYSKLQWQKKKAGLRTEAQKEAERASRRAYRQKNIEKLRIYEKE